MRVEVYGCPYTNPIIEYTAPPGDEFSPGHRLADIYDGESEDGGLFLRGGLGLLTDGDRAEGVRIDPSGNLTGKNQ